MANLPQYSGKAVFCNGTIQIRVPIKHLPTIVRGMFDVQNREADYKVTDPFLFAVDVVNALNDESEDGTTLIHKMFDDAFDEAVNQGAEGIELKGESNES